MSLTIRAARSEDVDRIAEIWCLGWHDGHAEIVPAALKAMRTDASFLERSRAHLSETRVAEQDGAIIGFSMLRGDEVYQFYVAREGRGTGVAQALAADVERFFREAGVKTAWLACSIGNDRAARFYEKSGWVRTGSRAIEVEVPDGLFALEVWRYEKQI